MYDYSYASADKRGYSEDITYLPTAQKSRYRLDSEPYVDRSPQKMMITSPGRRSKLSEAKESIDECIFIVSDKKNMNEEAIYEVKHVNSEVLGALTAYNPSKQNIYENRNKTEDQVRKNLFRDEVITSQFQWAPTLTSPKATYHSSFKDTFANQENSDIGTKLNNEIRKNNDLVKYIGNLENQLATIRASKAQSATNATMNEVIEENRYLKSQIAASQTNAPINLLEQLERLKAENGQLRRDTITLLKMKQS